MSRARALALIAAAGAFAAGAIAGAVGARPAVDVSGAFGEGPGTVRAIWVVRESLGGVLSPERIADEAVRLGANTLFVQVTGRGDAWYDSRILPRAEELETGAVDPFGRVVAEAHRLGLSVHAWVNVGVVWSSPSLPADARHLVHRHPEWIQRLPDGRSMADLPMATLQEWFVEGLFAEPANPDYRRHIASVVRELLERYPIDGIHLDYIRRPVIDTGYDEATLAAFRDATGYDRERVLPESWQSPETWRWPDYGDSAAPARTAWNRFRRDAVTATVWNIRAVVDEIAGGTGRPIVLSAAVIPDPDRAARRFAQDWPQWLRDGAVDCVVPMCYRAGRREAENQLLAALRDAPPGRVIAGVGVYQQPVSEAALSVRRMLRHSVRGVSLFSYGALEESGFHGARLIRQAWYMEPDEDVQISDRDESRPDLAPSEWQ